MNDTEKQELEKRREAFSKMPYWDKMTNALKFAIVFWIFGLIIYIPFIIYIVEPNDKKQIFTWLCHIAYVCDVFLLSMVVSIYTETQPDKK